MLYNTQKQKYILVSLVSTILLHSYDKRPPVLFCSSRSTDTQTRHARVVVARTRIEARGPAVDVDVLHLDFTLSDRGRDKDMVELLLVVVEHVRVTLDRGDVRELVDLRDEALEGGEGRAGLYELVKVACDDDVRVRVECEKRFEECLRPTIVSTSIRGGGEGREWELTATTWTCVVRLLMSLFTGGRGSP